MERQGPWWKDGVRWECQQSGKCCVSHGEYGFVYLAREDRRRLARHFGLTVRDFLRAWCRRHGGWTVLKDAPDASACIFFADGKCSVYDARPTQCRTWPFWPELMNAKRWASEVASFCPGVGKGDVVPAARIRAALREQKAAQEEE